MIWGCPYFRKATKWKKVGYGNRKKWGRHSYCPRIWGALLATHPFLGWSFRAMAMPGYGLPYMKWSKKGDQVCDVWQDAVWWTHSQNIKNNIQLPMNGSYLVSSTGGVLLDWFLCCDACCTFFHHHFVTTPRHLQVKHESQNAVFPSSRIRWVVPIPKHLGSSSTFSSNPENHGRAGALQAGKR